jgi:hypothetical protein
MFSTSPTISFLYCSTSVTDPVPRDFSFDTSVTDPVARDFSFVVGLPLKGGRGFDKTRAFAASPPGCLRSAGQGALFDRALRARGLGNWGGFACH